MKDETGFLLHPFKREDYDESTINFGYVRQTIIKSHLALARR
jgi:hypothetical protein